MRPKVSGRGCAGSRPGPGLGPGPGDPAALTCAPSASPALELSAQPQARGTGQRAGSRAASGSQVLSEAGTGARPASEAGVKAGARRLSAFSAIQGDVRSVPNNSDAPWARFVFQGPFGSRATGLGTGKAAGIWKTPAAYFGRRPGVSGPERVAFIRELEEGKPGPRGPGRRGDWGTSREEVAPSGPGAPPPLAFSVTRPPPPRCHCGICLVTPSPSPPPLLSPGLCP